MSTFIASRRTSSALISSPLMGPDLYFGKRIATSGQTRLQAGQSVLQFDCLRTWILPLSTPRETPCQKAKLANW